ncbi:MAG: hypothetical protein ACK5JO_12315 [Halodesulfovibrio sp.]
MDDPINCVDPWGLETKGVGLGVSASGFGFGVGAGAMVVKDDKGNWGVEYYGDYGASSGFGVSGEASYQTTTAETIKDLAGTSQKAGVSYQLPVSGSPSFGIEKIKGSNYSGDGYSVGIGVRAPSIPIEARVKQEHSTVKVLGSTE